MKSNDLDISKIDPTFREIPEIELLSIGLGTKRTSATYIAVLLQLEAKCERADILVSSAKALGITLEEIQDTFNDKMCSNCGMSMKMHKDRGGKCF
jgi:hypothetical protein